MASLTSQRQCPSILPYRDQDNTIKYATLPSLTSPSFPTAIYSSEKIYEDSDAEPLIRTSHINPEVDNDALLHFTATGRPIPAFKHSAFASMARDMYTLPQLLPKRYTDDCVIPAIVTGVIPSPVTKINSSPSSVENKKKSKSYNLNLLRKFRGKGRGDKDGKGKGEKGIMKVVYMPRRDYLKFFARDSKGGYVGSEPYRRWSEEELEREFGRFVPKQGERKGYRVPS